MEVTPTGGVSVLGQLLTSGGDELLLHVFSFLSFRDVCRLAPTCRRFSVVASDEALWRSLCLARLSSPSEDAATLCPSSYSFPPELVRAFLAQHTANDGVGRTVCTWREVFRHRLWLIPQIHALCPDGADPRQQLLEVPHQPLQSVACQCSFLECGIPRSCFGHLTC